MLDTGYRIRNEILPGGLMFFTFWRPTFKSLDRMVIPPMRGLSAESEKKNRLCVLGVSSAAGGEIKAMVNQES
jgi:hypothetical protein